MTRRARWARSVFLGPRVLGPLLALGAVTGLGLLYVLGAASCGDWGFPLDDGWIHQTYARNLAQSGRWAFVPGEVSAGSTAPLWTLALALGHLFGLPPVAWSHALGAAGWALTAWTAGRLARRLFPEWGAAAPWVSASCLLEWHLAWAALSGMETMLFIWLSLLLLERYAARSHPLALGLLGGLLVLARPEGIVLVGLVAVAAVADHRAGRLRGGVWGRGMLRASLAFAAGMVLLVGPYLASNAAISGQILPNTFYAKQAEYHAVLDRPLRDRLWRVMRPTFVGGQVLLLPGAVLMLSRRPVARRSPARERQDAPGPVLRSLPAVWWAVYLGVYALRLPVDYQHGRYLMPTIPILLLYGVVGTGRLLRPRSPRLAARVASRALPLAAACLFIAFLLLGRQAYVDDVCFINGEMVQVARWLANHTPPEAVIAAHDIGAIGYISQRTLIDLAGLITPDVVPLLGDEPRLMAYLLAQGADYLVTFPSWYPEMTRDPRFALLFQTDLALTREKGGDNMAVYEVR